MPNASIKSMAFLLRLIPRQRRYRRKGRERRYGGQTRQRGKARHRLTERVAYTTWRKRATVHAVWIVDRLWAIGASILTIRIRGGIGGIRIGAEPSQILPVRRDDSRCLSSVRVCRTIRRIGASIRPIGIVHRLG